MTLLLFRAISCVHFPPGHCGREFSGSLTRDWSFFIGSQSSSISNSRPLARTWLMTLLDMWRDKRGSVSSAGLSCRRTHCYINPHVGFKLVRTMNFLLQRWVTDLVCFLLLRLHDWKQLQEERVYFSLLTVHHQRQDLKAKSQAEATEENYSLACFQVPGSPSAAFQDQLERVSPPTEASHVNQPLRT